MKWAITVVLATAILSGCATPYQETGFTGGVSASRIDGRTMLISSIGNSFTRPATIMEYALLRAAEETLKAGYGHFHIVDTTDTSTVFNFPNYGPMPKPGTDIMVRMFPGPKPVDSPYGVFDALEVLSYLGPKYGR